MSSPSPRQSRVKTSLWRQLATGISTLRRASALPAVGGLCRIRRGANAGGAGGIDSATAGNARQADANSGGNSCYRGRPTHAAADANSGGNSCYRGRPTHAAADANSGGNSCYRGRPTHAGSRSGRRSWPVIAAIRLLFRTAGHRRVRFLRLAAGREGIVPGGWSRVLYRTHHKSSNSE